MKKISLIIIIMLLYANLSFCFQEITVKTEEMNVIEFCVFINWELKERKQATKKFVRRQFKKGYSPKQIKYQVTKLTNNTKERQTYLQAENPEGELRSKLRKECTREGWLHDDFRNVINTPSCNLMKQNYFDAEKEYKELQIMAENTPEKRIEQKFSTILSIEEEISSFLEDKESNERKIKYILGEKQKIEEQTQELFKEKQEFLNSLLSENSLNS
jgi:hypothetical protein